MMIEGISTIMEKKKVERLVEYKKAKHKSMLERVIRDDGESQGFKGYLDKAKNSS